MWGVQPLHQVVFLPELEVILDQKDIKNDQHYKNDPANAEKLTEKYASYIAEGTHEINDRKTLSVKFSSPERGYGIFAKEYYFRSKILG